MITNEVERNYTHLINMIIDAGKEVIKFRNPISKRYQNRKIQRLLKKRNKAAI